MTSFLQNILPFCFVLLAFGAFAQPDLPSEEVEVIKDFEATLEETERIEVNPELPAQDTSSRNLTYDIPAKNIAVEYLPPKIRPIATKGDPIPPSYKAWLKLGYGIPASPYAELAYNHVKKDEFELGGQLRHHSANFKDRENQRFSFTNVNGNGTYFFEEGYALTGNLGYTADEIHFYGYDQEVTPYSRDDVRQQFNTFAANAKFFNAEKTQGDLNYHAGVDFYTMEDNYASRENGVLLDFGVTKWFGEVHPLTIGLTTDFTNFKDTATQTLNNFFLTPSFTYHGDQFKVKVGGRLTSHKDNFRFFPDVEAAVKILGNKLTAFAGWEGNLQKNNFQNLSDFNPFMVSRFELTNADYNDFFGGVRGTLKVFDYQAQIGLKQVNNLALFLNAPLVINPIDTLRFNVLYDSANVFYLKGTLTARPYQGLEVLLTISQNAYSLDNQDKAWHLPSLDFNLGASYKTLEDKLKLSAELFIQDGVPYRDSNGETQELNALVDLSLGGEYLIAENFGLFLQINNLLSNKRQRWNNYPTYGLNILGGLVARF
ncbi:MAG: hypothetical protein AAFV95_15245 [Bacteroidota bacterium]